MKIRRLESLHELFAVSGGDFLLRNEVPEPSGNGPGAGTASESGSGSGGEVEGAAWLAEDGTFAFGGPAYAGAGYWVTAIGAPETAALVLRQVGEDLEQPLVGASMPRGTEVEGLGLGLGEFSAWDFMVFGGEPADLAAVPGFGAVERITTDGGYEAELEDFLKQANPTASARPGWDRIRMWGGVRDADGTLAAVGALCRPPGGHAHLASIGTRPSARGRGLGAAVTAWLTAQALAEGDPFCALGHWVPNEPARRVYLRLGYRTTHAMTSGRAV